LVAAATFESSFSIRPSRVRQENRPKQTDKSTSLKSGTEERTDAAGHPMNPRFKDRPGTIRD
jgi:hypothetical protein